MGVFRTQQTRPFSFDLRPLGLFRSLTKLLAFGKKAARKTQKQSQMPGDLWGQSRSDSGRCSFCGDFRGRAHLEGRARPFGPLPTPAHSASAAVCWFPLLTSSGTPSEAGHTL